MFRAINVAFVFKASRFTPTIHFTITTDVNSLEPIRTDCFFEINKTIVIDLKIVYH